MARDKVAPAGEERGRDAGAAGLSRRRRGSEKSSEEKGYQWYNEETGLKGSHSRISSQFQSGQFSNAAKSLSPSKRFQKKPTDEKDSANQQSNQKYLGRG